MVLIACSGHNCGRLNVQVARRKSIFSWEKAVEIMFAFGQLLTYSKKG